MKKNFNPKRDVIWYTIAKLLELSNEKHLRFQINFAKYMYASVDLNKHLNQFKVYTTS